MKAHEGVEVQLQSLPTLTLEGGEWSATRPSRVITCVHWITNWVRPIAGMTALWKDLTNLPGELLQAPRSSSPQYSLHTE